MWELSSAATRLSTVSVEDVIYDITNRYSGPDFTFPNDPGRGQAAGAVVHGAAFIREHQGNVLTNPSCCTGGGAGNFGVRHPVLVRSPDASGDDPARLLPRAPESITTSRRNGTGATSTSRPSCDFSGITASGASETAAPSLRTPLSGPSWRFIASSSERSSSAVVSTAGARCRAADR